MIDMEKSVTYTLIIVSIILFVSVIIYAVQPQPSDDPANLLQSHQKPSSVKNTTNLKIYNVQGIEMSNGNYQVSGQINNGASKPVNAVVITRFYDSKGNTVELNLQEYNNYASGGRSEFSAVALNKANQITSYTVEAYENSTSINIKL